MADPSPFTTALAELSRATAPDADLCTPFIAALAVTGAAVSTLGDPLGTQTVCASDETAAELDEIQIDLGEGPCWDALRTARPVLEPDVQETSAATWPVALIALRKTGLGAVFAFPLIVATIRVGAVDLYSATPRILSAQQLDDARVLAGVVARHVLRRALLASEEARAGETEGTYSRREVHQATGMVIAQMRVGPDEAMMVIRGHAFASGRSVRDVAADIVLRRLDFSTDLDNERTQE
ncbi:GAF domain-containing protein [Frondihabitans sucicola]|uniref:GAF domain-containing protein n=1 Tax=Frondihabitans sucicola TaxID=1268041 RepID=A0ABN6Y2H1_9MICO|nr:GAF and ANTAR domain-containing protein [Frondihabitans sucicola]BDZ51403.1 GAF domain-containing protein [Frondihabitans sucicola]